MLGQFLFPNSPGCRRKSATQCSFVKVVGSKLVSNFVAQEMEVVGSPSIYLVEVSECCDLTCVWTKKKKKKKKKLGNSLDFVLCWPACLCLPLLSI